MDVEMPGGSGRQSLWPRRRYIVDRGYLRPVGRVEPERELYDPFGEGYFGPERHPAGKSLYIQLLELDLQDEHALEAFATQWGLLGLMQHRIVLQPDKTRLFVVGDEYRPTPLWDAADATIIREVSAPEYIGRYFPPWPNKAYAGDWRPYPPPTPDRWDAVWDAQCEPLEEFRGAVARFAAAFRDCERWNRGERMDWASARSQSVAEMLQEYRFHQGNGGVTEEQIHETLAFYERQARLEIERHFEPHLARVCPNVYTLPGADRWERGWSFPSLLSILYLMLQLDFTGGRVLRNCENPTCGNPFVADHPRRVFCGDNCLNVVKQRNFRKRRKGH